MISFSIWGILRKQAAKEWSKKEVWWKRANNRCRCLEVQRRLPDPGY